MCNSGVTEILGDVMKLEYYEYTKNKYDFTSFKIK